MTIAGELKKSLWGQFGASIDMLGNAIAAWPDAIWERDQKVFYISFHCLFFLDYFLTNPPAGFKARFEYSMAEPGHFPEGQLDDITPAGMYSKAELLEHLGQSRVKCRSLIEGLTEESFISRWVEGGGGLDYNLIEMLMYNMRHVQHHAAQLNMMLRREINSAPEWIGRVE